MSLVEEIKGQPRAIGTLQAQLQSGRLHHAYIFHGPSGVGKYTTATAFAEILLCAEPSSTLTGQLVACEGCESCLELRRNVHPDLHLIHKERAADSQSSKLRRAKQTNIPVDLLRELVVGGDVDGKFLDAPAYQAPMLGSRKVFIIDEAELLDAHGQNALLKTLEEPPAGTFLILVTSSEERLLPTIRSRCQRVTFTPLDDEIVSEWVAAQDVELDDFMHNWLVSFSGGSLGRAQNAIEYNLMTWAMNVLPEVKAMREQGRYPFGLGDEMAEAQDIYAKRWVDEHENASKEAANRQAAHLMFTVITQYARQQIANAAADCDPNDPIATEAALAPWLGAIEAVQQAEAELASHLNISLISEHLVAQLMRALSSQPASGNMRA